jgi:hypothetical protein
MAPGIGVLLVQQDWLCSIQRLASCFSTVLSGPTTAEHGGFLVVQFGRARTLFRVHCVKLMKKQVFRQNLLRFSLPKFLI